MEKNKKNIRLSVCMILKNEGQTIYRCLESLEKTGAVDEYILGIDDSCTDNTEAEVKRFSESRKDCNIYKYKWNDDFAAARNQGMDKATGDYILIMDGHEYIPAEWHNITECRRVNSQKVLSDIKKQVSEMPEDKRYHQIFLHLYQQPFNGEVPANYFMQPRIYKNCIGADGKNKIRYGRKAHNVIRNTDREKDIHYPECILIHDAPADNRSDRKKQRLKMNEKVLSEEVKNNPKDLRALFYLGNTFLEAKKFDKAIKAYRKYLALNPPYHNERYQVHINISLCYKNLGKINEAMETLYQALSISNQRRDAYQLIGDFYSEAKNYEAAILTYSQMLIIPPAHSRMFCNGPTNTFLPHLHLSKCYEATGKIPQAIAHLKAALNYLNNPDWYAKIKELKGDKKKVLIIDAIGSFTKDLKSHLEKSGYEVVKIKEYNRTLALWADYIWQEWADNNAAQIEHPHKTIVRIHGYEAYLNAQILGYIPFDRCKDVVFVAKHIQSKVQSMVSGLNGQVRYIPNGVDLDKFYIKNENREPNSVGIAGYMNVKKNPMRLARIIKDNPDMMFHLRIDWQDAFLKDAFTYETAECKNIVYHGRYKDLNDFWNQMEYVISTSDIESFSFNVAEAMAAGCTPLVYNWFGAEDIWHKDFIFTDKPVFKLRKKEDNRRYIKSNYPLDESLKQMTELLS